MAPFCNRKCLARQR
uniref:Uncharacterized protein n=1 Tax=Anguilla anguilla TaxID=7936 RepID=A0A0E9RWC7_ANGAN